ncbi:MAG: nitroreductase family deazaflavin-dependent oxidoreductase [Anaerolineales bacterium]|nr:nitroreductase family deazaflavin-dependent oxidoreductase [Anaerolineales bacterium]
MGVVNFNWQRMKHIQKLHRVLYAIGLGPIVGKIILLLTTTGRKTGLKRVTPLQYEEIDGKYFFGAARGLKADWVRNIQANPQVEVRVKSLNFQGQAEVVTDPVRIADFIEVRLQRHPFMIGMIMQRAHGLSKQPSREQLERLAEKEVLVIVTPVQFIEN